MPKPIQSPDWGKRLQLAGLWCLALGLIAVTLVFYTGTQDQFELPKQLTLRAFTSLGLGFLLAWLLAADGAQWRRSPLDLPVLAWSLWLLVTTVHSVSPGVSWRGEYENFAGSLTQLNYSVAFFLALQLGARRGAALTLATAVLSAATGAALYASAQALQRDLVGWAAASVVGDRFFGSLGNPNFLAGLMAMAIPLKLALALHEQRRPQPRDREGAWRWALLGGWVLAYLLRGRGALLNPFTAFPGADTVSGVVLGLWLVALGLAPWLRRRGQFRLALGLSQGADLLLYLQVLANTGTRGGFLGLVVGLTALLLGWMALWQRQRVPLRRLLSLGAVGLLGLGLALVLVIGALGPSFRTRVLRSLRDPGQALEESRLQIWGPALRIWRDHPIAGTGVDTFKTVFPAYASSRFNHYDGENVSSRMAHCEPLQVLATQGLVGLALWLWFCAALAWAAVVALRREADEDTRPLWLGLGALAAAYLAQNLVSFGVAAISLPFWVAAGLLAGAAADPMRLAPLAAPARRNLGWALLAGGAIAVGGLWLDSLTLRADLGYAFANQAVASLPVLEKDDLDSCRGAAAWALNSADTAGLSAPLAEEAGIWRQAVTAWEQQLAGAPSRAAEFLPMYRRAAGALMMILAAQSAEDAVALCPDEVKYRLYAGLCYEELYRRTPTDRRNLWFKAAEADYLRVSAMNPRNAYYQGNLGRLYEMAADNGDPHYIAPALAAYQQAIERAPASRMFYENTLLLQAHFADLDGAAAILKRVADYDQWLAPGLHMAAASTFFQWRGSASPAWTDEKRKASLASIRAWAHRALDLDPNNADYALSVAEFELAAGARAEALRYTHEALRLRPGFPDALGWAQQQHLKL